MDGQHHTAAPSVAPDCRGQLGRVAGGAVVIAEYWYALFLTLPILAVLLIDWARP